MSRNGKIHTKKRQFRQMPVLAFLNQRLFLQPRLSKWQQKNTEVSAYGNNG